MLKLGFLALGFRLVPGLPGVPGEVLSFPARVGGELLAKVTFLSGVCSYLVYLLIWLGGNYGVRNKASGWFGAICGFEVFGTV